jgi:SAM-dependent methyltransferase
MRTVMSKNEFYYDAATAFRYDAAVPDIAGEVEFYLELAQEAKERGLRTLELTCGTGRVTVPLAKAGIPILGVDISPDMLARARAKSDGIDNVEWREGDMRSFDLGEQFGLVMIPVGSFQLLLDTQDQLDCLRCIKQHLAPGGRLAFEIGNPILTQMADLLTTRRGVYARNPARDFVHPETGRRFLSWGTTELHPTKQQYVSRGLYEELDDEDRVIDRVHMKPMAVRYFYRYEQEHLFARAGLEIEALYGDVLKRPYTSTSPDFIWVLRKA